MATTDARRGEDLPPDLDPRRIPPDLDPEALVLDPDLGPALPALPEGLRVRAGSYNVYGLNFADAEAIGGLLASLNLDIVGLQECPAVAAAAIAAAGGFPHWFGEGTVLLSKTALEAPETVALETGRSFVHANTTIEGVAFSVYCAHLGWDVEGDLQCREFVDGHLSQDPTPHLVLVGDFNDEPLSTQINILEEVVSDAATAMGWYPGERISWPSTGFDETEGSQLIDLIFFRKDFPAIVLDAEIVNLSPVLSDHKPAWAELLFPGSPDAPFAADPLAPLRAPLADLPPAEDLPENLLLNPGAEDGLQSWEVTGAPRAATQVSQLTPRSGARFFAGFPQALPDGALFSSGSQTVSLGDWGDGIDAREAELYVSGYTSLGYPISEDAGIVANRPQAYDDAELITTLLDATGAPLARFTSGRRDALAWYPYGARIPLPPGTRGARLTWLLHHRGILAGNDAAVDDLYLGVGLRSEAHRAVGGELLQNPGAEDEALEPWEGEGWVPARDLDFMGPWGISLFPPTTQSGLGMFTLGAQPLGRAPAGLGTWEIAQTVDLAPWRAQINGAGVGDGMALRWGGWLRTLHALGEVHLSLDILDPAGETWASFDSAAVPWAEWTRVEGLLQIPPGATGVRIRLVGTLPDETEGLFADGLFLRPETP